jgi:hypothetical protein
MVTPSAEWLEVTRVDHNLGKIHDAEVATFELAWLEDDRRTVKRRERLAIPGGAFRKVGLGKDVTDKFLAGLPGVQKEGTDGIVVSARFVLHRMPPAIRSPPSSRSSAISIPAPTGRSSPGWSTSTSATSRRSVTRPRPSATGGRRWC